MLKSSIASLTSPLETHAEQKKSTLNNIYPFTKYVKEITLSGYKLNLNSSFLMEDVEEIAI
jgi:hypothetical protein